MVLNLFHGDDRTCGVGTSGGTESIMLAMLAYREQGRARGVIHPNIVCSETAHSAFVKAAFYFGLEVRKAKLTKDLLCDVAGMKKLIDSNTVCLVSSGPEYPFGNFDPLPEIAALALKYNIGCHYDCCIGLINVFAEEAGFKLPYLSDFRVVGLTSISVDTHKYGFGPKGYSLCLFRSVELRDYQFFTHMDWNGGFYATPSMAGSRAGATIVGTWTALCVIGREKYVEFAKKIFSAQKNIIEALKKECPEVDVGTRHTSSLISIVSKPGKDQINCIALCDVLHEHFKWSLNKSQKPSGLKLVISETTAEHWQDLIRCIKAAIKMMKENPALNHNSDVALYGMAGNMPDMTVLD